MGFSARIRCTDEPNIPSGFITRVPYDCLEEKLFEADVRGDGDLFLAQERDVTAPVTKQCPLRCLDIDRPAHIRNPRLYIYIFYVFIYTPLFR